MFYGYPVDVGDPIRFEPVHFPGADLTPGRYPEQTGRHAWFLVVKLIPAGLLRSFATRYEIRGLPEVPGPPLPCCLGVVGEMIFPLLGETMESLRERWMMVKYFAKL